MIDLNQFLKRMVNTSMTTAYIFGRPSQPDHHVSFPAPHSTDYWLPLASSQQTPFLYSLLPLSLPLPLPPGFSQLSAIWRPFLHLPDLDVPNRDALCPKIETFRLSHSSSCFQNNFALTSKQPASLSSLLSTKLLCFRLSSSLRFCLARAISRADR